MKQEESLEHIGTKRHSGRYPWGSGGNSEQSGKSFLTIAKELRDEGFSRTEIAKSLGLTTTEFIEINAIERSRERAANSARALRLKDKGLSKVAIGDAMGLNESSVRALLNPKLQERASIIERITELLKSVIAKKGAVDIGGGVEAALGISRSKLNAAVRNAQRDGYEVFYIQTPQLTTGKKTSIKVLAPPGTTYSEVYAARGDIGTLTDYSPNKGRTFLGLKPVESISSDRIAIAYNSDKDGVIELRRGVSDLNMGGSHYAQVRIGVDDTHYLKGMAVYGDSIPVGKDILFHTNKTSDVSLKDVLKPMTGDSDNPFGATIKAGGQKGALNIVYEEGDWSSWSRTISSQVLSKQRPTLAKRQLELDKGLREEEFSEIMSITNPVVRQTLLQTFSDSCDSAAVDLKAASLPRQASHVILPVPGLKPNEIYAPMYANGEPVVLIRHPHGGIFEIPEVTVNNKNQTAKDVMGNAIDAIGIHPDVAHKLSGADFDGDIVIVIPNTKGFIKTAPSLTNLRNFDPQEMYPYYDGMKKMTTRGTALHMGNVTNLITDMTIKGANQDEIARAVRHSMVVIDAEKHGLNYVQSAKDNGISALKEKYQGSARGGAATLISRSSSQQRVGQRVEGEYRTDPRTGKIKKVYIDPNTGEKLYTKTDETYTNRSGKLVKRELVSTKMAEAKSAYELSSGTTMENIYADYADSLKILARKARLEMVSTPRLIYDPEAKKQYQSDVDSITAKIKLAEENRPRERKAQLLADKVYRSKLKSNPELDSSQKKRLREQALMAARIRLDAKKPEFELANTEWTALDMGAISHNRALQVMRYADLEKLKAHALPRRRYVMTDIKMARARMMTSAGYTPSEIAAALGVSPTTVTNALSGS